jgi:hypothetical protein
MDHECGRLVVHYIDDFDKPATGATALHKPRVASTLAGEAARTMQHDRFNFRNRASMFCRALKIPLDPSEVCRRHLRIFY